MADVYCAYEDEYFPEAQFDSAGVHLGTAPPRHYMSGDAVSTKPSNGPLDFAPDEGE